MARTSSRLSKRFDFEKTLKTLEKLARRQARRSKEDAAIEFAAMALHFVYAQSQWAEFLEYVELRDADPAALVSTERSFKNKAEAMKWLRTHPSPSQGLRVEAAGITYVVARQRIDKWLLVPTPSHEELAGTHRED